MPPPGAAQRAQRRRRRRHLRQLRRDLLFDVVAALAVTSTVLIWAAGLGVVALLELPAAATVAGSFALERARRRRRRSQGP